MDEINLAQYSSAFQRFLAIFAFHQMSESAKSPNSLSTRSCVHLPPHQDTRIGIQVRSLWDGHSQTPCVLLEKWFEQRRPEPRLVRREIGAAHPLHHCLVARQQVRIDVESDCLLITTALPQQFRIAGRSQYGVEPAHKAAKCASKWLLACQAVRRRMRQMLIHRRDLYRDLPAGREQRAQSWQQLLMVGYPVQRRVRVYQVEWPLCRERLNVGALELHSNNILLRRRC